MPPSQDSTTQLTASKWMTSEDRIRADRLETQKDTGFLSVSHQFRRKSVLGLHIPFVTQAQSRKDPVTGPAPLALDPLFPSLAGSFCGCLW